MPDPEQSVKKVLISLDITEDVVDFAIENQYDTIIYNNTGKHNKTNYGNNAYFITG